MWWPKCLTYGNWGGPGWSGGVYTDEEPDWSVDGIDAMDRLFRVHDWTCQHGDWQTAHRNLARDLYRVQPPATMYGKAYRAIAFVVFNVLSI